MQVFKVNDWLGWTGYHGIQESSKDYDVVINLGVEYPEPLTDKEHITLYFHDAPGWFPYDKLYELCKLMERRRIEGKKVLVHCLEGNSRSAGLIMCYMTTFGDCKDTNDAFADVIAKIKPFEWNGGKEDSQKSWIRPFFQSDWRKWIAIHRGLGQWIPAEKLDGERELV